MAAVGLYTFPLIEQRTLDEWGTAVSFCNRSFVRRLDVLSSAVR